MGRGVGADVIIGNGDIASAIVDRPDRLFFASGVSFSGERRPTAFGREINLLLAQPRNAHLVYFSSLSIYEKDTPYTRHKRCMEELVRANFDLWAILRIGNIDWGTNPTTLINHLRARHAAGLWLHVEDVYRYVLDREGLRNWIDNIPPWPVEFNCLGRRLKVAQIVDEFVLGQREAA